MPVRIYDISKKLGLENKEVLAKAKALGISAAKVASSSLDKITAEYLEEQLVADRKPAEGETAPAPVPAPAAPAPSHAESIVVIHAPEPEPAAAPVPEPAAVETAALAATESPAALEPATDAAETVAPAPETEASPAAEATAPAPVSAPKPPSPAEPPKPKVGDKVGFIQLPSKPAPRVGEKVGSVKLPPARGSFAGRNEPQRGPDRDRDRSRPGAPSGRGPAAPARPEPAKPATPKYVPPPGAQVITLKPPIVVRDLADQLKQKPFKIIADLMEAGVFANVNQAIDENIAQRICGKYGFRFEVEKRAKGEGVVHAPVKKVELDIEDKPEQLKPRAPIVTIMGHVDHGKTSLLDVIRQANVAAGEAGGITQHIGAYTISFPHPERKKDVQQITFLDTPGHEAFSAMRARGANVTDIVILVVAANDGVMPQTVEALNHARAAKVPIIVAVNKMDHPNANSMRVRQQLQEKGLVPDDWGGDTIFVECSALAKTGVDKLLEMILLQADLLELKANPDRPAKGNVIESGLEPGGPTATVLVRKGTLHVGDIIICDKFYGKARALINEEGNRLKEAGPSVAVRLLGLNGVPEAGIEFSVVKDEKSARDLAEQRQFAARAAGQQEARAKVTLENLFATLDSSSDKVLKLVVKADTQGSVEAIVEALKKIPADKVQLEIVHSAVGTITESDVSLAAASQAVILGFHTRIDSGVNDRAKRESVQIKLYAIIYELIDEVKEAMAGLLDPILKEVVTGVAEVRKVFELSKGTPVAGCMIASGRITKGKVRVRRRKDLIYEGIAQSLRRFQDEVNEVRAGMECGIRVDGFGDFEVGDTIESYSVEKVAQKL
ncbi:MAG TPA: translation initiation factor IF-2 [Dongiaceae bacterium]|nr:translation initiation factor IF-2 [Dongiaceae bacterium]